MENTKCTRIINNVLKGRITKNLRYLPWIPEIVFYIYFHFRVRSTAAWRAVTLASCPGTTPRSTGPRTPRTAPSRRCSSRRSSSSTATRRGYSGDRGGCSRHTGGGRPLLLFSWLLLFVNGKYLYLNRVDIKRKSCVKSIDTKNLVYRWN